MVDSVSLGPGRHEARERVVGLLYEAETRDMGLTDVLEHQVIPPDPYCVTAIEGIELNFGRIDDLVASHSQGWALARLALVDRAILRLGVWELLERGDVPVAVIIDEAVELAKDYSTEGSPGFVNGVLDAIAAELR